MKKRETARDKMRGTEALGSWGRVIKKERARDKMRGTKALGSWGQGKKKREIKRGGLRLSVVGDE